MDARLVYAPEYWTLDQHFKSFSSKRHTVDTSKTMFVIVSENKAASGTDEHVNINLVNSWGPTIELVSYES